MLDAAGRHQEQIETNGVTLRTIVEGEGPLAVLLHGFPRCWYLWRHLPAYFLAGRDDPVLQFSAGSYDAQDANFADLRGKRLIDAAGHWVQEEKPAETTSAIIEFLTGVRQQTS